MRLPILNFEIRTLQNLMFGPLPTLCDRRAMSEPWGVENSDTHELFVSEPLGRFFNSDGSIVETIMAKGAKSIVMTLRASTNHLLAGGHHRRVRQWERWAV